MANITKPAGMSTIWAVSGIKTAPADLKIAQGWVVELPPYQTANYIENKQDQFNAHVNMHGMAQWDNATEYQGGISLTKGSNGKIYKCLLTHTNLDPINPLNSSYWVEAFEPFGSVAIVAANLATLTTNYGTLAGLTSAAAARANLSVYSKIESDIRFASIGGLQTQTFAVAAATQPYHAVRLDQISGLFIQATESTMGVAKIASSIDMAAGTNDTNIVTPLKGRNTYLTRSLNLSDLTSPATARVNLGLGSIATEAAGAFLRATNNLSELTNTGTARTNLGLGTSAVRGEDYFLRTSFNLSDLPNVALSRTNLGLGDAAVRNIGTTIGTAAAGDDTRIVNAVQTSLTITAGNGLTGGGNLTSNRTITLGTPGTISSTTGNTVSTSSHTHALDINSFFGPRSLSTNGHYELPGGFILQWGTATVPFGSEAVTFPRSFDVACFNVQMTGVGDMSDNPYDDNSTYYGASPASTSGFTAYNRIWNGNNGVTKTFSWFAIGR